MTGNPHDANAWARGACPCCAGPFDTIKRDLAMISRLLSAPLPPEVAASLTAEFAAVKLNGRAMLDTLPAPGRLNACNDFVGSVENFSRGVDQLRSVLPPAAFTGDAGTRLIALRFAFRKLAQDALDYTRAVAELHPEAGAGD